METNRQIVLLGSALTTRGERKLESLDDHAVVALAAGAGDLLNAKKWICEDSLALHQLRDGSLLAAVADAHYGGWAGEVLIDGIAPRFEASRAPSIPARLTDALRGGDARLHAERPEGDVSETTILIVHVSGRTVSWVSIGDSYLFVCGHRARILNQDSFTSWPRYAGMQDLAAIAPRGAGFDHGQTTAHPGECVLLATDGIETRSSGIELADVATVMRGPGPLRDRLANLQALCDRVPAGGRDNLGLVAIAVR